MDVRVKVDLDSLVGVRRSLREDSHNLLLAMSKAINDTAKHAKSFISRVMRQHVPIAKRALDKSISRTFASPDRLEATVTVTDKGALPLKWFKPKQTAHGVTVIADKLAGRTSIILDGSGKPVDLSHAFIVDKLGGHVFRRRGAQRLPIEKLFGPSPLDAYEKAGAPELAQKDAEEFLQRRMDYRLGRVFEAAA